MSSNDSAEGQQVTELKDKSKGKQVEQNDNNDMSMDDESEGEDSGVDEVSRSPLRYLQYEQRLNLP